MRFIDSCVYCGTYGCLQQCKDIKFSVFDEELKRAAEKEQKKMNEKKDNVIRESTGSMQLKRREAVIEALMAVMRNHTHDPMSLVEAAKMLKELGAI